MSLPEQLRVSPPEGFAYYGLHPIDFATLADSVGEESGPAAIIGIRSIGTTLSAIVLAAIHRRGKPGTRITVRPTGHPYDRVTRFTPEQLTWIESQLGAGSNFLVVDEGPGRSGSSFLSVAEALERAGVPAASIILIGSRPISPDQLCATNAAARWNRFRFVHPTPNAYHRFEGDIYIGGGAWRKELLKMDSSRWPACWQQMERFKFLSADRKTIFKFEGFGRFGEEVLQRAQSLAQSGFGPSAEYAGDGMIQYPVVPGTVLDRNSISPAVLDWVAEYCAFRVNHFRMPTAPPTQLPEMVRFNVQQEFGVEPNTDVSRLCSANPILVDGRMQLHEWILRPDGRLIKVDGSSHGDDHFFPGPTDIAWDLAGVIVEWDLDKDAVDLLLSAYCRRTGDDSRDRIKPFLLAYSIFRMGHCKMALSSVAGTPEYARLQHAAAHYRSVASLYIGRTRIERTSADVSVPPDSRVLRQSAITRAEPAV